VRAYASRRSCVRATVRLRDTDVASLNGALRLLSRGIRGFVADVPSRYVQPSWHSFLRVLFSLCNGYS
jgi:hypothetical protein